MIMHSKPNIEKGDIAFINGILNTGMLARGNLCELFESKIADYIGCNYSLTCSNGSTALFLALKALEIENGDEVILPSYVCHSVEDVIRAIGAIPIFCDIGQNWVLSADIVEKLLSRRTRAVVVVHTFGIAVDVESFRKLNISLIEDCCQALGTKYNEINVGSIGDISIFSFHATKCMTCGEGGALLTNNKYLYDKAKTYQSKNYIYGLTDYEAALGISQFQRYEKMLEHRREIAQLYFDRLNVSLTKKMRKVEKQTNYFRFLLCKENIDFDEIKSHFEKQGISVRRGVDKLLHKNNNLSDENFINSIESYNTTISIPIYPSLLQSEIEHIINVVNNVL